MGWRETMGSILADPHDIGGDWERSLKRLPTTLLGGPVDLANLAIGGLDYLGGGKGNIHASEKPVGGSQWLAEQLNKVIPSYPTQPGSPNADMLMSLLAGPVGAASARGVGHTVDAIGAAKPTAPAGSPAAQAGVIRVGGDPNLQITHTLSGGPRDLYDMSTMAPYAELSNPSFAIRNRGTRIPFFTSDAAMVIPRIGAVDPSHHPGQLYNRDAWVTAGADQAKWLQEPRTRLSSRFGDEDLRFGSGDPGDEVQSMAIQQSPTFKSFKDYEQSPAGAKTLLKNTRSAPSPEQWGRRYEDQVVEWLLNKHGYDAEGYLDFQDVLPKLRADARTDLMARELLKGVRRAPSDYAELKTQGPLALTPEKVAGVVLPPRSRENAALADILKGAFDKRGLKTYEHHGGQSQTLSDLIDFIQNRAGPFGGR